MLIFLFLKAKSRWNILPNIAQIFPIDLVFENQKKGEEISSKGALLEICSVVFVAELTISKTTLSGKCPAERINVLTISQYLFRFIFQGDVFF